MRIGLFHRAGDRQSRQLLQRLNALQPGSALSFDHQLENGEPLAFDAAGMDWSGTALGRLETAFLHGFGYCDPIIPDGRLDDEFGVWRYDYLVTQSRYTALHSLFTEMGRRGVRMVNPIEAYLRAFMKPWLMEHLRQNGFRVPQFVCTNEMEQARAFCARHPLVVWRPSSGRALWQLFKDRQREALVSLQKPPVALAEVQAGPLVRAFLHEGRPLLQVQQLSPHYTTEEILEETWEADFPAARPVLARVCECLQMPWCQVLYVWHENEPWIYDVDADPIYEWLPRPFVELVSTRLAGALLRLDTAALRDIRKSAGAGEVPPLGGGEVPPPERRQQRPTMFLRRMLTILFEFEQSKYR